MKKADREWTEAERKLLWSELSNKELAEEMNRSVIAVRRQRYLVTGHYVEENRQHYIEEVFPIMPILSPEYKELRIKSLAKKLGVRLYEDMCE